MDLEKVPLSQAETPSTEALADSRNRDTIADFTMVEITQHTFVRDYHSLHQPGARPYMCGALLIS